MAAVDLVAAAGVTRAELDVRLARGAREARDLDLEVVPAVLAGQLLEVAAPDLGLDLGLHVLELRAELALLEPEVAGRLGLALARPVGGEVAVADDLLELR